MLGINDMCFQIITIFVSYRHESFAYNTLFHFGFIQFWSKDFLDLAVKFALSLWHIIGKKHKMYTYTFTLGKFNTNI
jgi:hypothetical protein